DLSLVEVSEASSIVQEAADEDANIIFGAVVDPALKGKVKITVIATGFGPQVGTTRLPQAPNATPVDMSAYAAEAAKAKQQPPAWSPRASRWRPPLPRRRVRAASRSICRSTQHPRPRQQSPTSTSTSTFRHFSAARKAESALIK